MLVFILALILGHRKTISSPNNLILLINCVVCTGSSSSW